MTTRQRATIDEFLSHPRLALVGYSTHDKDFSHTVAKELGDKGFDVVPVNPNASEIGGKPVYPRVQDIQPPVDGCW